MTTSKDISGGMTAENQCSATVTSKSGARTCQHKSTHFEGGKHYCGLHAPSNIAKKKAKKEAKEAEESAVRAEKLAAKQPEPEIDGPVVRSTKAVAAVKLPDTVEEAARLIIVLAQEAQQSLVKMSNMTSRGWPENTPAENYKIMLQTINDEAKQCAEQIRLRMAKAKEILQPVAYP